MRDWFPENVSTFGSEDDLTTDNELHIPVGKIIHVPLSSKDVIHSFFLPQFRLKQDAVPGHQILV